MNRRHKLNSNINENILDNRYSHRTWQIATALSVLHKSNDKERLEITFNFKNYLQFIKKTIKTTNNIFKFGNANSWNLQVRNIPELYRRMEQLGITSSRRERTLDKILVVMPEEYEQTLIRTVYDMVGSVNQHINGFYYVKLSFRKLNNDYRDQVAELLNEQLNIPLPKHVRPEIIINQEQIPRFREYMYSDIPEDSFVLKYKRRKLTESMESKKPEHIEPHELDILLKIIRRLKS